MRIFASCSQFLLYPSCFVSYRTQIIKISIFRIINNQQINFLPPKTNSFHSQPLPSFSFLRKLQSADLKSQSKIFVLFWTKLFTSFILEAEETSISNLLFPNPLFAKHCRRPRILWPQSCKECQNCGFGFAVDHVCMKQEMGRQNLYQDHTETPICCFLLRYRRLEVPVLIASFLRIPFLASLWHSCSAKFSGSPLQIPRESNHPRTFSSRSGANSFLEREAAF